MLFSHQNESSTRLSTGLGTFQNSGTRFDLSDDFFFGQHSNDLKTLMDVSLTFWPSNKRKIKSIDLLFEEELRGKDM